MYPRQRQCGPVYDFPSSFKVFQQERDKLCISKVATALTRPWFRAACFTQLMTTERLCLGHGHIDISIISDSIDPHGNQAPSNTTG